MRGQRADKVWIDEARGVVTEKNSAIAADSGGAGHRRTDLRDMPGYIRPEDRIEAHAGAISNAGGGHPLGLKSCRCLWAHNRVTGTRRIVASSAQCDFHGHLEVL